MQAVSNFPVGASGVENFATEIEKSLHASTCRCWLFAAGAGRTQTERTSKALLELGCLSPSLQNEHFGCLSVTGDSASLATDFIEMRFCPR